MNSIRQQSQVLARGPKRIAPARGLQGERTAVPYSAKVSQRCAKVDRAGAKLHVAAVRRLVLDVHVADVRTEQVQRGLEPLPRVPAIPRVVAGAEPAIPDATEDLVDRPRVEVDLDHDLPPERRPDPHAAP